MKAVFLDRDGVLVAERDGFVTGVDDLCVMDGVPQALTKLKNAGFLLIIVTNQPVVARGLIDEAKLADIHDHLNALIKKECGFGFDAITYCPHHPNGDVEKYRQVCDCRKPAPGLLLKAKEEFKIDLSKSFMVGDRLTDIMAGKTAGTKTVLVKSGKHLAPLIESVLKVIDAKADFEADTLLDACDFMVEGSR